MSLLTTHPKQDALTVLREASVTPGTYTGDQVLGAAEAVLRG